MPGPRLGNAAPRTAPGWLVTPYGRGGAASEVDAAWLHRPLAGGDFDATLEGMPTLQPGTEVSLRHDALRRLSYPPSSDALLLVAVHAGALRAPASPHTQLIGLRHGDLAWAGALSEHLLTVDSDGGGDPRQLLGEAVGIGPRLWDLVWPGELLVDAQRGPLSTTYQGERPWVVIGAVAGGDLLAAPLNDAANPKWFTPLLARDDVRMPGSSKDSQLELAHVWSFPQSLGAVGTVAPEARTRVLGALRTYF